MIEQGICYLTLAEKGYPKRLAFMYLEEIHQEFVEELRHDHGEDWRNRVSSGMGGDGEWKGCIGEAGRGTGRWSIC